MVLHYLPYVRGNVTDKFQSRGLEITKKYLALLGSGYINQMF